MKKKKKLCISKDMKNLKTQPRASEKIFAKRISDKRLIFRIYNKPLQLNHKESNNPMKNFE